MFWTILIVVYSLGWLGSLPYIMNTTREIRIGGRVVGYHKMDWLYVVMGLFLALLWPIWISIKLFGKVMK